MTSILIDQYEVPSSSKPDKTYIVTHYEGGWKCSCPHWIYRLQTEGRDCKHIEAAKSNQGHTDLSLNIVPANVKECILKDNMVLVPLIPFNQYSSPFVYTIIYDCRKFGVEWGKITAYLNNVFPKGKFPSYVAVKNYIERTGRLVHEEWVDGQGWTGYIRVPVEENEG